MKHYIAIPHTLPARRWEVESIEAAAIDDGLEIDRFDSKKDLEASFDGEQIPESYAKSVENTGFPCVHVYDDAGNFSCWEKADRFDAEQTALDFFQMEYNSIIKIESIEDAKFYAEKYAGHQCAKVRSIAADILEEMEAGNE